MNNNKKLLAAIVSALFLSACASTQTSDTATTDTSKAEMEAKQAMVTSDLEARAQALNEREAQLARAQAELDKATSMTAIPSTTGNDQLLPPKAKAGECYARVWVKPTYKTNSETILVSEASEKVTTTPAQYETVTEEVLVKEASFYMEPIPAVYGTEKETRLISEGQKFWSVDLQKNAAPASDELLTAAKNHGINLDAATPGTCYHEHYIPAQYETVSEQVLVEEAYDQVSVSDAKYNWIEKEVLVREASTKLETVPAKYETITEQLIDKPAHTVWKKGTGPIQRIDEATGEIMCLVEVPATYKTISKRVLKSAATTRTVNIPAEYKTVKVRELVSGPEEIRNQVPAKYKSLSSQRKIADKSFVWHEIHNRDHPASTRTGNKICLIETAPRYETITKTIVKTPASTRRIEVPAEYKSVKVNKVIVEAKEMRQAIPARYETVTSQALERDGFMEWRSILCETNMTAGTISSIQRALSAKGYNPGSIDGVIGSNTIKAVNEFQVDNKLPTDKYINIETVRALGIDL
ncbi:MAG: peptidoglycan-binding protein [Gammaproteobacteria bacterium]